MNVEKDEAVDVFSSLEIQRSSFVELGVNASYILAKNQDNPKHQSIKTRAFSISFLNYAKRNVLNQVNQP